MVSESTQQGTGHLAQSIVSHLALSTEVSILATNKLFELAGTRATLDEYNLHRHWRNARAHTVHDPVRWKYHAIGNFALNGIKPPRHGAV